MPYRRTLADRLRRLIAAQGPIPVSDYMALANAHYYATRDPLGAAGDFITAPEISQMFGELIGLALADVWVRAGRPEGVRYVEFGPGRGTLAADALRAMRAAGLEPEVHFIETSPVLRAAQAERVPARVLARGSRHPGGEGPDPCRRQRILRRAPGSPAGQDRRRVAGASRRGGGRPFPPVLGGSVPDWAVPETLLEAPSGTLVETSLLSRVIATWLAFLLKDLGGAALFIDYGHDRVCAGETLQAVRGHGYADPWTEPGEADLTAHVDFESLALAGAEHGARVHGPVGQGDWLRRLGIEARVGRLAETAPQRDEEIRVARDRLVSPDQMGRLFRVMGLSAPSWPALEGFNDHL